MSIWFSKKGNLLCLITDYMALMGYTTLKVIADLLVGKTIYHIKNIAQFRQQLRD